MTCSKDFGRLLQATCLGLIGMLAVAGCGGSETKPNKDGAVGDGGGTPPPTAALNVTPSSVNLGTLGIGESSTAVVTVTNTGKGTSGAITATGSAGITVSGCAAPLAGGGSCTLSLAVAPATFGSFSGTVSISATPGATTPLVVAVIAQVSPQGMFTVLPKTIDLGNIAVGAPAPRQTITVTAAVAIADLTFSSNGPDVSIDKAASTCTATLAAGASCTLAVNFVAATSGVKNEGVVISGGGAKGQVTTVPIAANAQAPALLAINPSTAQTISVSAGQTSSPISFIVANAGDVPTGTVSAALTGANAASFAVTSNCLVLAPLAGCNVSVTYSPAAGATAPEAATLVVTDTGPGASSVQVAITGMPYSQTDLVITSTTTDLGTVLVGSTGPSTVFTVTNNGATASGALTIAVSSPEFVVTNDTCTGTSLPKDGTCAVSLALKPSTLGVKNATLTATGAAAPAAPAIKQITGAGITTAGLSATPPTLDFATVRVNNTSAAQTVTIRNTGGSASGPLSFTRNGNFAAFPLSANTCSAALAPGATCTFSVSFSPVEAKSETASYTITDGATSTTVTVSGTGLPESGITVSPSPVSACAEPNLSLPRSLQSNGQCFATTVIGGTSPTIVFTIKADSTLPNGLPDTGALTVALGGTNATDFSIVENACTTALLAGASCQVSVAFTPTAIGLRQASLNVTTANGGADSATMQGTGLSVIEIRPLDADPDHNVTGLNFGQVPVLGDTDELRDFMVIVRGPNTGTSYTSQVLTTLTDPTQPANFMYPEILVNPCNTSGNTAVTLDFQAAFNPPLNAPPYNPPSHWYAVQAAKAFICEFTVKFYPQSTKGEKTATLTATGTGPVTDTKELTGTATGALTFEWLQPPDFGDTWQVGESSNTQNTVTVISLSQDDRIVTLVNHSTTTDLGPVALTMGGTDPDQFYIVRDHCSTLTLSHGGDSCEVGLAFAPTSAGQKSAILTANAGGETTTVTITGGAMDPFDITISPDQYVEATKNVHDFGTVAQEAGATWHAFTITNPAGSPRSAQVWYGVDDMNEPAAFNVANGINHEFGTCGGAGTTTLSAGQSCTFWVQFKPTAQHAVSSLGSRLEAWIYAIDSAKGKASAPSVLAVGKVSSVLTIAPAEYTFPDTPQGTVSPATTLTVTNHGSSTTPVSLTITTSEPFSVAQSSECYANGGQLAAGQSCALAVNFIGEGTPSLAEESLTVAGVGYTSSAVTTALKGKTVTPAKLEAVGFSGDQLINLGGVRIGDDSGSVTLTFKNTGSAATGSLNYYWNGGSPNTPDDEFKIASETGTGCVGKTALGPGETCTVTVFFRPGTVTGEPNQADFRLSSVNGGAVDIFSFIATALEYTNSVYMAIENGTRGFYTFPNSIPVNASTFPTQVFQLHNTTANPLALAALTLQSGTANFTLIKGGAQAGSNPCVDPIPAASTCTFAVQFMPTEGWTPESFYRHGVVTIGGGAQLGVLGRVQSPAVLSLTPDPEDVPNPYDFGQVVIGGTNPTRAFTVTNIGEQTSVALTVTAGAPYAHAGACDGATLAAGQSCIGSVSVNPGSTAGPLTDGVLLVASGTNPNTASADLKAEAVRTTTLTLDVSTVSFAATSVGVLSQETKNIVITNAADSQTSGLLTISIADTTNFSIVSTGTCPVAGDPQYTEGLAAAASCTVTVAFKPMTLGTGTFSTTLVVNASPGNTQTVNISGTAVSALKTLINGTPMTTYSQAGIAYNTIANALPVVVHLESGAPATDMIKTSITGGNYMIVEDQCVATMMSTGSSCLIKVVFLGTANTPLQTGTLTIDGGSPGSKATLVLNSTAPAAQ